MRCATKITNDTREGRYVHRCTNCGREVLSVSKEKCARATCRMPVNSEIATANVQVQVAIYGPGDALEEIFSEIGAKPAATCKCEQNKATMNRWGIKGCRDSRDKIIEWLKDAYREL